MGRNQSDPRKPGQEGEKEGEQEKEGQREGGLPDSLTHKPLS